MRVILILLSLSTRDVYLPGLSAVAMEAGFFLTFDVARNQCHKRDGADSVKRGWCRELASLHGLTHLPSLPKIHQPLADVGNKKSNEPLGRTVMIQKLLFRVLSESPYHDLDMPRIRIESFKIQTPPSLLPRWPPDSTFFSPPRLSLPFSRTHSSLREATFNPSCVVSTSSAISFTQGRSQVCLCYCRTQ